MTRTVFPQSSWNPRIFRVTVLWSAALVLAAALSLSGCGGGAGGGGGATAVTGQAIDAPISNATITLTLNAPLGQPGAQTLQTTTADGDGNFTLTVSFPSSGAPVFANARNGTTLLSSYLGPASTLASLSTLNTDNVPDLAISQVTTAALSILAATHQLGSLTPSSYATLLSRHRSDIIAAAAAVMAVVDSGCPLPPGDPDTFDLATTVVTNTTATTGSTPTLTNASATLGGSCNTTTLQNLLQAISAGSLWAPELDLGDVVENTSPAVPAGNYTLQGLLADTGISLQTPSATTTAAPPVLFNDATVSVDSSGKITSTSGNVSGQVTGNFITLGVNNGTTYSFNGKLGLLPSGWLSQTTNEGFSLRTGGAVSGNANAETYKLDAVLVPAGSSPAWAHVTGQTEDNVSCSSPAFGLSIHGLGPTVGGDRYEACATPGSTGLSLTSGGSGEDEFTQASNTLPNITLNEVTNDPFVLQSSTNTVALGTSTGGTLSTVMGSNEMLYNTAGTAYNTTFLMNENPLDKLAESPDNTDH